jgi:hypothetical protein
MSHETMPSASLQGTYSCHAVFALLYDSSSSPLGHVPLPMSSVVLFFRLFHVPPPPPDTLLLVRCADVVLCL